MELTGASGRRAERRTFALPPRRGGPKADPAPVPLTPRMAAMRHERWGELLQSCNALAEHAELLLLRFRLAVADSGLAAASGPAPGSMHLRHETLELVANSGRIVGKTSCGGSRMGRAGSVLVVDDDDDVRACVATVFREAGYEVLTAPHGAAALELLRAARPDAIVLDLRMPVMDGPAFARAYRELPGPHAPIIVATAAREAAAVAAEIGASSYLAKPFEIGNLVRAVAGHRAPAR